MVCRFSSGDFARRTSSARGHWLQGSFLSGPAPAWLTWHIFGQLLGRQARADGVAVVEMIVKLVAVPGAEQIFEVGTKVETRRSVSGMTRRGRRSSLRSCRITELCIPASSVQLLVTPSLAWKLTASTTASRKALGVFLNHGGAAAGGNTAPGRRCGFYNHWKGATVVYIHNWRAGVIWRCFGEVSRIIVVQLRWVNISDATVANRTSDDARRPVLVSCSSLD